ncbi:hypothetical protein HDU67_005596 [Dinochytrium kinnereticum]|nr:hypothetical protein HDU67_005596 [Dinochytrium kinnereticum]
MASASPSSRLLDAAVAADAHPTADGGESMEMDEISDDDPLPPSQPESERTTPKATTPRISSRRKKATAVAAAAAAAAAASASSNPLKRRNNYLDAEKAEALRRFYDGNQWPTPEQVKQMAEDLQVDRLKVKNWFANQRFKSKKDPAYLPRDQTPAQAASTPTSGKRLSAGHRVSDSQAPDEIPGGQAPVPSAPQ